MTTLPGDIFLHSAPLERDTSLFLPAGIASDSSSSVISPCALPRAGAGYFDPYVYVAGQQQHTASPPSTTDAAGMKNGPHNKARTAHVSSPPASAAHGPPTPHTSHLLSPRLAPAAQGTHHMLLQRHPPLRAPSLPPTDPAADAAGAPSPQSQIIIGRLVQQNSRIREAWEAERKYLEANRERAEEVYKEERGLMEEERAEWDVEREALLRQVASLRQQVASSLGGSHLTNGKGEFAASPGLRGGGGCDMSPETSQGNARRPRQQRSSNAPLGGSGGELSTAAEAVSHAAPLLQSEFAQSPSYNHHSWFVPPPSAPIAINGFFGPPSTDPAESAADTEDMTPVPTVDVREIIPTLEGIPIKAAAIQRHTFTDHHKLSSPPGSKPSSRTPSPPADQSRPDMPKRGSKEQTLQVLAADATDRLTMHAGHTPSHSLSVLPTVTAASLVTTASSSGSGTPTMPQQQQQPQQDCLDSDASASTEPLEPVSTNEVPHPAEQDSHRHNHHSNNNNNNDHPEPILEADEDVELKGPLMVRNMPVHDEIFFRRLSDKLEEVSRASGASEAAVPAVLREAAEEEDSGIAQQQQQPSGRGENNNHRRSGGNNNNNDEDDGAADASSPGGDRSSRGSNGSEEMEVPLKLRRRNNFGAPFGEIR